MKDIVMRKIAHEDYDFYPLPQMMLETGGKQIRIKDGEIAKEWSKNVTYFKFSGEGINVPEHAAIQHFVTTELKCADYAFISGLLEEGEVQEYHLLVKNKSPSGKKFDFDKVKLRTLRKACVEEEE